MAQSDPSIKDLQAQAADMEAAGDKTSAIHLYQQILEQDNLHINAYNSLMKLYRRGKEYKKELSIVNKAIKNYEAYFRSRQPKHNKSIKAVSEKLNKAFGLMDKKGNTVYSPEPIGSWKKRKLVIEKRMGKL